MCFTAVAQGYTPMYVLDSQTFISIANFQKKTFIISQQQTRWEQQMCMRCSMPENFQVWTCPLGSGRAAAMCSAPASAALSVEKWQQQSRQRATHGDGGYNSRISSSGSEMKWACLDAKIKISKKNFGTCRLKSRRNKKRIATAVCKWRDESNEPN